MASRTTQGGASALPIARAFIGLGGRLLVSPKGKLEIAGGMRWALTSTDAATARRSFIVERRLCHQLRNRSFARSVKCLVLRDGEPTPNGWLVMAGEA